MIDTVKNLYIIFSRILMLTPIDDRSLRKRMKEIQVKKTATVPNCHCQRFGQKQLLCETATKKMDEIEIALPRFSIGEKSILIHCQDHGT